MSLTDTPIAASQSPVTEDKERPSAGKKSMHARLKKALKISVTVALVLFLIRSMWLRDGTLALAERITSLDPAWLLLAVILHLTAVFAGVVRWRRLLVAQSLRLPFAVLLRSFLIGRFVGAFTPSTTGLDGWRVYEIGRLTGATGRNTAAIIVEKMVGLLGMALVSVALVPFGGFELMGEMALVWALLLAFGAGLGLWLMGNPDILSAGISLLPRSIRGKVERWPEALSASRLSRSELAKTIALGVVSHLALSAVFFATGRAVGIALPASVLLVVGNAIVLAVLLPISLGGVGVREGVAVLLLGAVSVGTTDAVLVALLGYLTGQIPALLGGLLMARDKKAEEVAPNLAISAPSQNG